MNWDSDDYLRHVLNYFLVPHSLGQNLTFSNCVSVGFLLTTITKHVPEYKFKEKRIKEIGVICLFFVIFFLKPTEVDKPQAMLALKQNY